MPPDSSQGYLSPGRQADRGQQVFARAAYSAAAADFAAMRLDDFERQQQVFQRGAPGQQGRRLERHAGDLDRLADDLPRDRTEPLNGNCKPVASFIKVDLPQPEGRPPRRIRLARSRSTVLRPRAFGGAAVGVAHPSSATNADTDDP
jgi:hypothetical protein